MQEQKSIIFLIQCAYSVDTYRDVRLEVAASGKRRSLDALRWTQELSCFGSVNDQNFSVTAQELFVALDIISKCLAKPYLQAR